MRSFWMMIHLSLSLILIFLMIYRPLHKRRSIVFLGLQIKSSRWEWLTPDLSHHRTYRSVYGGSIKIVDVKFHNVLISFGALGNSNRNSQGFCVVLDY